MREFRVFGKKTKVFAALFTAAALLVPMVGDGFWTIPVQAVTGETSVIEGMEWNTPINLYDAGIVRDFTLGSDNTLTINDPYSEEDRFSVHFNIPASIVPASTVFGPELFLIPVTSEDPEEAFIRNFQLEHKAQENDLYPILFQQKSVVTGNGSIDFTTDDAYFMYHEYFYVDENLNDVYAIDSGVPPTGTYYIACMMYNTDMVYFDGDEAPATFIVGGNTVYIDNPADVGKQEDTAGSENGDSVENEEKGNLIDIDIKVFAGETEVTSADTIVYGSKGMCYGYAPCKAYVGEEISVTIRPTGWCEDLKYDYDFPETRKGNPLKIVVPEDGQITVNIPAYKKDITVSGYVYDEENNPIPGATVSAFSGGYTSASFTAVSDKTGFYRIEGITASMGLEVAASKKGCIPSKKVFTESEITDGSQLSSDFNLKYKTEGFTVRIVSDADEELLYEVASLLENGGWSEVFSAEGKAVNGEYVMTDIDCLAFYPDTEDDLSDTYIITVETRLAETEVATVGYGDEMQLVLKKLAGIRMNAQTEDDSASYLHLCGFEKSGDIIINKNGKESYILDIFEASSDEQKIDLIGYAGENAAGPRALNYGELPEVLKENAYKAEAEIKSGSITDLGEVSFPFIAGRSGILNDSYVSVSSNVQRIGDTIKVKGHIASNKGDCTITALRIYGWSAASDESFAAIMAGYKNNSLVINGSVASAELANSGEEYWNMGRLITLAEPVTGEMDFSCSLEVYNPASMIVIVEADGTDSKGKPFEKELIGECSVSGVPVSLKTSARTAGGTIKCSGVGAPYSEVNIMAGDILLGKGYTDEHGTWEARVDLPFNEKSLNSVRLHASCAGARTGECIVIYDPDHSAAEQIYLTEDGEPLSNTYVWRADSVLAAEAVVGNPEAMGDSGTFFIMCSDGTMISLDAHPGAQLAPTGSVNRQIFTSDTYDFGAKNLVPTKVWFNFDRGEMPEKIEGRAYLYSGAVEREGTDVDIAESENLSYSTEMLDESEAADKVAVTTVAQEITSDDMTALLNDNDIHLTFYGDEGEDMYELATVSDGEKYTILIRDVAAGKCYRYDTYVYDGVEVPTELERTSATRSDDGSVFVSDTVYFTKCGNVVDTGKTINDGAEIISLLMDPTGNTKYTLEGGISALLQRSPKLAFLAPVFKYVGIGDLVSVYRNGALASEVWSKSEQVAEDIKLLNFMEKYGNMLSEETDARRSLGSIAEARMDLDRAIENQKNYMTLSLIISVFDCGASKIPDLLSKIVLLPIGYIKDECVEAIKGMGADSTWAMAQENVTEAKNRFLKMTSLSNEELLGLFNDAERGVISDEYVLRILRESMKDDDDDADDGEEEEPGIDEPEEEEGYAESEDSIELQPIIDPSGYVYEAVASNRIEGAVVTLYSEGMEPFDAGLYGQENPLISDAEGKYAWDVPEGNWFVEVYLHDYEEASSQNDPAATVTIGDINYLPVLPPQLDVNIPVTSTQSAKATLAADNGIWYLIFDKYVDASTINESSVSIDGLQSYKFTPTDEEVSPDHTPICGGKNLARTFMIDFLADRPGRDAKLAAEINDSAICYNGLSLAQTVGFDENYKPENTVEGGVAEQTGSMEADPFATPGNQGRLPIIPIAAGCGGLLLIGGGVTAFVLIKKKKGKGPKNK